MSTFLTRPEIIADYIIQNNCTIRQASNIFKISKSTVHLDVSKRLKKINKSKYALVRQVLENNLKERNIRGGMSTKLKYQNLKLKKENG